MKQKNKRTIADIDLSKIDLTKHRFTLKAGTTLYRVIIGKFDPRIPTGQENRYAKNPNNVSIKEFQEARFNRIIKKGVEWVFPNSEC